MPAGGFIRHNCAAAVAARRVLNRPFSDDHADAQRWWTLRNDEGAIRDATHMLSVRVSAGTACLPPGDLNGQRTLRDIGLLFGCTCKIRSRSGNYTLSIFGPGWRQDNCRSTVDVLERETHVYCNACHPYTSDALLRTLRKLSHVCCKACQQHGCDRSLQPAPNLPWTVRQACRQTVDVRSCAPGARRTTRQTNNTYTHGHAQTHMLTTHMDAHTVSRAHTHAHTNTHTRTCAFTHCANSHGQSCPHTCTHTSAHAHNATPTQTPAVRAHRTTHNTHGARARKHKQTHTRTHNTHTHSVSCSLCALVCCRDN